MKETHEHLNSFFKQPLEDADIGHLLKLVARSKRAKVEAIPSKFIWFPFIKRSSV